MRYAPLTQAIQGETVDAWDIHFKATALKEKRPKRDCVKYWRSRL